MKKLIAGNWKMNNSCSESVKLAKDLVKALHGFNDADILLCPSFTSLPAVYGIIKKSKIKLGAQNMHYKDNGAFTGEISPLMLKDTGCSYVIVGHSERRHLFNETDGLVHKKIAAAIAHKIIPILCIGETELQRKSKKTKEVIEQQITSGLGMLDQRNASNIVIAYEPVWAIGTGNTATTKEIENVHGFVRDVLAGLFEEVGKKIRIVYGGSVKPDNAKEIMSIDNVDGVLVGGASLDAKAFVKIARSV